MFFLTGKHRENEPKAGGFMVCANHRSFFDPVVLAALLHRKPTFMAKAELFKNPVIGRFLRALGAFPIERGKGDVGALKTTFELLKKGYILVIFPEGKRMKGGARKKSNPGMIRIAAKAGVPILPAGIEGDYRLFHRVTVHFGKPMDFSDVSREKLTDEFLAEQGTALMDTIYRLAEGETENETDCS